MWAAWGAEGATCGEEILVPTLHSTLPVLASACSGFCPFQHPTCPSILPTLSQHPAMTPVHPGLHSPQYPLCPGAFPLQHLLTPAPAHRVPCPAQPLPTLTPTQPSPCSP